MKVIKIPLIATSLATILASSLVASEANSKSLDDVLKSSFSSPFSFQGGAVGYPTGDLSGKPIIIDSVAQNNGIYLGVSQGNEREMQIGNGVGSKGYTQVEFQQEVKGHGIYLAGRILTLKTGGNDQEGTILFKGNVGGHGIVAEAGATTTITIEQGKSIKFEGTVGGAVDGGSGVSVGSSESFNLSIAQGGSLHFVGNVGGTDATGAGFKIGGPAAIENNGSILFDGSVSGAGIDTEGAMSSSAVNIINNGVIKFAKGVGTSLLVGGIQDRETFVMNLGNGASLVAVDPQDSNVGDVGSMTGSAIKGAMKLSLGEGSKIAIGQSMSGSGIHSTIGTTNIVLGAKSMINFEGRVLENGVNVDHLSNMRIELQDKSKLSFANATNGIYNDGSKADYLLSGTSSSIVLAQSDGLTEVGIYNMSGASTFTLSGANSKIAIGSANGGIYSNGGTNLFTLSGEKSSITTGTLKRYAIWSDGGSTTFNLSDQTSSIGFGVISSGTMGQNLAGIGVFGRNASLTFEAKNDNALVQDGGKILITELRGSNKDYILKVGKSLDDRQTDTTSKLSFIHTRLYYGEYTAFDSGGDRAGLYANFANLDKREVFYRLGKTVITNDKATFDGASDAQTRFLLAKSTGKQYGIYFKNVVTEAKNIGAKITFEENGELRIAKLDPSKSLDAVYVEGKVNLDLGESNLFITDLSSTDGYINAIHLKPTELSHADVRFLSSGDITLDTLNALGEIRGMFLESNRYSTIEFSDAVGAITMRNFTSNNADIYGIHAKSGGVSFYNDSIVMSNFSAPKGKIYAFYNERADVRLGRMADSSTGTSGTIAPQMVYGTRTETNNRLGFYANDNIFYHFGGLTTLSNITSEINGAVGMHFGEKMSDKLITLEFGDLRADGTGKYDAGELVFKNIQGAAQSVGIKHYSNDAKGLNITGEGILAFERIAGNHGAVYGFQGAGKVNIENGSKLYFGFDSSNASNVGIKVDDGQKSIFNISNALVAFNLGKGKFVEGNLNLVLDEGARVIIGAQSGEMISTLEGKALQIYQGTDAVLEATESFSQSSNAIIDLATTAPIYNAQNHTITTQGAYGRYDRDGSFRTLTIGSELDDGLGLVGNNILFRLYADERGGDKIVVNKADGKTTAEVAPNAPATQTHYFQVMLDSNKIASLKQNGFGSDDVVLIQVKEGLKDYVRFEQLKENGLESERPQSQAMSGTKEELMALETGNSTYYVPIKEGLALDGGYYQYYIPSESKLLAGGLNSTYAATTIQAHMSIYQLFMANINSLNKRMGDLRDSQYKGGFWTRVLNGWQSMDGLYRSDLGYTTAQFGFDGGVRHKESKTYIGVAFGYSYGLTEFNNIEIITGKSSILSSNQTHALEGSFYVSYVADAGFYSDSIAKFSYFLNTLNTTGSETYKLQNMGASFSQEFGYRYLHESGFFLDPQAEVSYGWLDKYGTDQASKGAYILSSQEMMHIIRGRAGLNFGWDFKNLFDEGSKANAKLYVGTYYVYDYMLGGEVTLDNKVGSVFSKTPYTQDGRLVLNVGTSWAFTDDTRMYLDLERSFLGKMTTEYQVNLGLRASFGEVEKVASVQKDDKTQAPLKLEDKSQEKPQAEEPKEKAQTEKAQESQMETKESEESTKTQEENQANQ